MERRPIAATVKTPAQNFTGDVYLTPIFNGDGTSRLVVGLVRFTPCGRTNWHSHANGQLLVHRWRRPGRHPRRDRYPPARRRGGLDPGQGRALARRHRGEHDVPLRDPRRNPRRRSHHLARTSHRAAVRRRQPRGQRDRLSRKRTLWPAPKRHAVTMTNCSRTGHRPGPDRPGTHRTLRQLRLRRGARRQRPGHCRTRLMVQLAS